MCSRELLLVACLGLLGGLRLTSTTTTTTLVAAMSIANQDLERYFRSANVTQNMPTMTEERILLDTYTYAYIKYTYMENNERKVVNLTEDQARYGEGKHLNVMGKLVHITDANNIIDDTACSLNIAGTGGSPTPAADTPWIALVRRGHCTFEEKVRNVYEKGAIGVIIYNDKIVMSLEKMQIKGKTRNITAVITYQNVGNEMVDILNQGNDVFVSIMTGSEGSRPVTALNRTSVLFVSVSFIVLMLISLVWLIFYYIQRFRYLQTKDQHSRQLCSVTKKAIMKIPTKTGKSSDEKDIDGDCCAICIEAYKSSDCIRVLPCKHEFHKHCIDPWLIEHRTCPMCKLDVLKFYGYVFLGSEESILEYDSRSQPAGPNTATSAVAGSDSTVARPTLVTNSALTDLIRSRDFVVDFPRVFILEVGSATGTHGSLFPARLPERSQSAMSLACAKDWMLQMTNKLDEQHGGLRRLRKASVAGDDMHENLLSTRTDSVNKRRSRSADGRYSNGYFGRKELALQLAAQRSPPIDGSMPTTSDGRRGSTTTQYNLTEARYAQSTRRRDEQPDLESTRHGRPHRRRDCIEIPLMDLSSPHTSGMDHADQPPSDTRYQPTSSGTNAPLKAAEGHITIQLNGEGIDLE